MIEFQNVSAYRGTTLALRKISFCVDKGQSTVVLGPNGAGKSTLLKLLSREIYPVSGPDCHLRLFGSQRWNVWDLRSKLGIVSADLQQQYRGTVVGREVIASGLQASIGHVDFNAMSSHQRQSIDQMIAQLRIKNLAAKPLAKMSTGEQRRCLLGRALINGPSLLVLDEPTTGMDLPSKFYYLELIERLIDQGVTVVLVTHHLDEIAPSIDNIVLLKGGEIVARGNKPSLLTDDTLTDLFDVKIQVNQVDGHYYPTPG